MFVELYKKIIASILSFFMSFSMFCGCAPQDLALDRITQYSGGVPAAELYDAGSGSEPDWKDASEDNNHYVQAVSGTTGAELDAYRKKLRDAGWQEVFYNMIETSRFYAYRKNDQQIYISFCGRTGEARLMDDSCSLELGSFGYTTNDAGAATVYQFGFPYYDKKEHKNNDLYANNGMLYVIRLPDNKLVIIDGGQLKQATEANVNAFADFLHRITGTAAGEKINVAMWYGTHAHSDHIVFMSRLIQEHRAELNIERFAYNYASYATLPYTHYADWFRQQTELYYPDAKYIKVRSGCEFTLANVGFEVLMTHEDLISAETGAFPETAEKVPLNICSSVLKVTSKGKSFLFLGDMDLRLANVFTKHYTAETIGTDVLQGAHHMYNDLPAVYAVAAPSVVMAPQSKSYCMSSMKSYKTLLNYTDAENFCFASEGTYGFTPTADGISVSFEPLVCTAYDGVEFTLTFDKNI